MARRPQRDRSDSTARIRIDRLSPQQRRQTAVVAALRTIAVTALVVAMYFSLPLSHPADLGSILIFVAGLVAIAIALTVQIRATMHSPYPRLRALETLGTTGPLFLTLFATTHYLIEHNNVHSYSQPMTRLDALYFTVTVFSTVGFGDIAPVTELARAVTLAQMMADLLLIFVVARVLFAAVQVGVARRTDAPGNGPGTDAAMTTTQESGSGPPESSPPG